MTASRGLRLDLSELFIDGARCDRCDKHEVDRVLRPISPAVAGPLYCGVCVVIATNCVRCHKSTNALTDSRGWCADCASEFKAQSIGKLKKTPMDSKCKKSTSGYTSGHSWYNTATQVRACRRCGRAKDFEDNELFIGKDGQLRHVKS